MGVLFRYKGVSQHAQTHVRTHSGYQLDFKTKIKSILGLVAEKFRFWEGHFLTNFDILTVPLSAVCALDFRSDLV